MSLRNKLLAWGAALSWLGFTAYYISTAKIKFSVKDLLLMMPECCEMTDLVNEAYFVFSPEIMIKLCFCFVLLHFTLWWMTAGEVVEKDETTVSKIIDYVKKEITDKVEIEEALLNCSKSIVDNKDLEFEHCTAVIGANNETPGQRVGGEVEWATGETTSEEEDATREVIGAHIQKPNEIEDEKILRCLTFPDEEFDDIISKKSDKEPHLTRHPCDADDDCSRSEASSWPFRELEVE